MALKEKNQKAGNIGWSRTGINCQNYLYLRLERDLFFSVSSDSLLVGALVSMLLGTELSATSVLAFSGILNFNFSFCMART